jgi:hypothetical protein
MATTLDQALTERRKRLRIAEGRCDLDMIREELNAIDKLLDAKLTQRQAATCRGTSQ